MYPRKGGKYQHSLLRLWMVNTIFVGAFLLLLSGVVVAAVRERCADGTLSLLVAVPLTQENGTKVTLDPGFFHLAAAKLAIEHFNERNPIVVPQLSQLQQGGANSCSITFDIERVIAVDTGTDTNQAMEYVMDQLLDLQQQQVDTTSDTNSSNSSNSNNKITTTTTCHSAFTPDAIAGPYNTIPALQLSILATGLTAPLVAHRAALTQETVLQPNSLYYFNQVSASVEAEMGFVGKYLLHMNRTDYVAILYNEDVLSKANLLEQFLLQRFKMKHVKAFGFQRRHNNDKKRRIIANKEDIKTTLHKVASTGYRTIVFLPEHSEEDAKEIGVAATKAKLDRGDHFWLVSGGSEHRDAKRLLTFFETAEEEYGATFLRGAAYAVPYEGNELQEHINFRSYLRKQDPSFFQRVLDFLPVIENFVDARNRLEELLVTEQAPLDALAIESRTWTPGAGFMYDAVMSIGLGACQATVNRNSTIMTGEEHLEGIRSLYFNGATGQISFNRAGDRLAQLVPMVVTNLIRADWVQQQSAILAADITHSMEKNVSASAYVVRYSESYVQGEWIRNSGGPKFLYGDGTTNPPMPLREEPEQNYVKPLFRFCGLILFAIALVTVLVSTLWVFVNRNHSVVIAGQPLLLYTLCFASLMVTMTILIGGFDESWGFSQEEMDAACHAYVWLVALGRTIAYGAIFTKLYRVNCLLRHKTSNNWRLLGRILWPFCLAMITVLTLLTVWQVYGDYGWQRTVVDPLSGESVGACNGEKKKSDGLLIPIYAFQIVIMIITAVMAFKALGIDDLYSESKWVLALVLVQAQVLTVAGPVVVLLNDVDPSARYIGLCLLMFSFPMTTMGLIILPKILLVRKMRIKGSDKALSSLHQATRAEEGGEEEEETQDARAGESTEDPLSVMQGRVSANSRIQMVIFD